ncbi:MAG TPA: trigger factor [Sporichthyaceae bacterium]|nr:trigger factor [Sporichthyaceae bacterium]
MKSAVETLNPTRVRLTVEVPFAELKPSLDAAYKKIAGQVNVPGFRKGKVPPQIIDKRFGRAAVLDEAVNAAIPRFYGQAVTDAKIQVLGHPAVDVTEFADGAELKFTVEVDVRPEFELPHYKGIEIAVDIAEVTDSEVDAQLDSLRARFATATAVDRPVQDDDLLSIDLSGRTKEGEEIADAQATGLSYAMGSGSLVKGLDEALAGMSAGESKTFASELVAGPHQGEEVDIEVTLQTVRHREMPELDDEFAQTASPFDTAEELRADMRTKMGAQKKLMQGGAARDKVLEALLEQVDIPLPEGFLHDEIHFRTDAIARQLSQAGMSIEDYLSHQGTSREEFDADIAKQSAHGMRAQFLLDAIARAENISVGQEELTRHLIQRASGSGLTPDQFAQQVVDAGQANMLVAEVVRSKALAVVLKDAKVTDTAGVEVDLAALRPEGAEEIEDLVRSEMEALHASGYDVTEPVATVGEPRVMVDASSAAIPQAPAEEASSVESPEAPTGDTASAAVDEAPAESAGSAASIVIPEVSGGGAGGAASIAIPGAPAGA